MSTIGRNDPCPCGSGRKFKHCCGANTRAAGVITDDDRGEAMDALLRFAERRELEDVSAMTTLMWSPDEGEDPETAFESFSDDPVSVGAYFDWFIFDATLTGRTTVAEMFLSRSAANRLSPRALDWVRQMSATHLRPYLVHETSESTVSARDLWTGDPIVIRTATPIPLVIWDVLITRVRREPSASDTAVGRASVAMAPATDPVMEGMPLILPSVARRFLLRDLKRLHRTFRRRLPDGSVSLFFKQHAPLFNRYWFDYVIDADGDGVETVEGEPVSHNRLVLDVPAARDALVTLLNQPDFEPKGLTARWRPKTGDLEFAAATTGRSIATGWTSRILRSTARRLARPHGSHA